ncbi:Uncharacterized protein PECH_000961 [Penicillium ucsense]|uniref:Uncharacterized protein n=1 Tax=Penicillium ucsense TaxID=2839758 RepID=A0A8J8W828_9EURO|nr:Uncharacterized protein PECM_003205 [Penicillium ucsense]KAF7733231.1 Uncharacterized protein PECH_000961 [Penicillium ucsense]
MSRIPTPSAANDVIAQEKAETQNMIIVRYWSLKRLDRLWDLVAQEAIDAANDPVNRKIMANYGSDASLTMGPLLSAAQGSDPNKLTPVTFGDSDKSLANLERSPKDMVQLSECAMNQLLVDWVPNLHPGFMDQVKEASSSHSRHISSRAYISSDGEDEDSDGSGWDGHHCQGYYLEGTTHDWRKPHSQEARQRAAQLRRQYADYQAQVESDPEDHQSYRRRGLSEEPRSIGYSDDDEHGASQTQPSKKKVTIQDPSTASKYPPSTASERGPPSWSAGYPPPQPPAQSTPRTPVPPQNLPRPPTQSSRYCPPPDFSRATPRAIPTVQPNPSVGNMRMPSPRPTPPSPYDTPWTANQQNFNPNLLQPRAHPTTLSTSSPEPTVRFRSSPPRSAPRSPSRSHRKSSKEEARERHKEITRSATRGLVGIGAIAGFMDALEAFSLL